MNEVHKIMVCLLAVLLTLSVGCNSKEKTGALDLLGEKETVLVEKWGPPHETSGQEFEFYEPYSGGRLLFYEIDGQEVFAKVVQGRVVSIGLTPAPPNE